MSGRFTGWHRTRGASNAPLGLRNLGKVLLGYLTNQQRLSGVSTLVIRRETPEGAVVARLVDGVPQVTFQVRDGGGRKPRYFRTLGFFTDYPSAVDPARVTLIQFDDYVSRDNGITLQKIAFSGALVHQLAAVANDANTLAVSSDGSRVLTCEYAGAQSYIELACDLKTLSVRRSSALPSNQLNPFLSTNTGAGPLYVNIIGNAAGVSPALARWAADDGAVPLHYPVAASNLWTADAAAASPTGRYCFVVTSTSATDQVVVFDLSSNTAVATVALPLTADGDSFSGRQAVASMDGTRLYITGITGPTGAYRNGLAVVAITYDDEGAYASSAFVTYIRGGAPAGIAHARKASRLYALDDANDWIWEYDTDLLATRGDVVTAAGAPIEQAGIRKIPFTRTRTAAIQVSADDKRMYVSGGYTEVAFESPYPQVLRVVDVSTGNVFPEITIGRDSLYLKTITVEIFRE